MSISSLQSDGHMASLDFSLSVKNRNYPAISWDLI